MAGKGSSLVEEPSEMTVAGADPLVRIEEAVEALAAVEPAAFSDPEGILRLARLHARLDGLYTRATAAFEAGGAWSESRAYSAANWLAAQTHLPQGEARRRVGLARSLRRLESVESAWVAGTINVSHAIRIAGLRNDRTAEALERDQEMLVEKARTLRYDWFSRYATYWSHLADPDGVDQSEMERRERRDVWLVKSFQDMYLGRMTLDPISGAIVSEELNRLEKELFEADWAEARARLGREPANYMELARSPGQRRADALVEMATRSRTAPADGRRPAPLFVVMVDYPHTFGRICELFNGLPVAPGALVPWLDQAFVERAVFTSRDRVQVSARSRLFSGATLRGLQLRDHLGCTHPFCFTGPGRCQADHVVAYSDGGPTTQENGRMACGRHNRGRNSKDPADQWDHGWDDPEDWPPGAGEGPLPAGPAPPSG